MTLLPAAVPPTVLPTPHRWCRINLERLTLTFDPATPYEAWEQATYDLLATEQAVQWLIGDALLFGEATYGERYAQVVDPERFAPDTVSKMVRTARAIPPERRRAGVSYSVHAELRSLPEAHQETLLDYAQEHDSTSDKIRTLARRVSQQLARERYQALAVPAEPRNVRVQVADARQLPLADQSADLIVTSPPYGLDMAYTQGDVLASDWPAFMHHWLIEAYRITKPSGRLALNVPLDTFRGGHRPTYHQALAAVLEAGWEYEATIIWHDGSTRKGNRALGSIDSAARPHHVSQVETIILASRGPWGPSSGHPDDISHEDWQEAGRGPWAFPGETHPWEHFPAAFPLELPRRLIGYLTRLGDVVCDPFMGSGTTLVAARALGRIALGYDLDPHAVASTLRRLAAV